MLRILSLCLSVLVLSTACFSISSATPTPSPSATRAAVAVDGFAAYRPALTSAAQNDLALLDRPTRYSMTLMYDATAVTLSGSAEVLYFNRQAAPLNEIYFRLFANYPDAGGKINVSQVTVDGAPVTPALEVKNTALRVPLAKPLAPNGSANLRLGFTVTLPRGSQTRYADLAASDSVVTMPTVYPLIPAYDANGWHIELPPPYGDLVYADASLYAVTLTVPSNQSVIASGSATDVHDNGNGTTTWQIVGAPMRDFDFNLTDKLQRSSTAVGETTVNSWYETKDTADGKNALKWASDALTDYQKRFGAYPYRELDVVETPTTAGGIEYPGIIVIGRGLYSNPRQREFFESAVVHEVSHQWWYGIVGDDQVNYPWVDEALAQYSMVIYNEDLRDASVGRIIVRNYFQAIYDRAKGANRDAAVNQPVSAFNQDDYSAIVYGKGPLFYDAIRKKMGDDKFFQFLKTYFERYRYQIAFPEDILKTAEDVYGSSLREEYQQWITSPAK